MLPSLRRSYPENQAFSLYTPEIKLSDQGYTCILGPNGSGKSTFGEALAEQRMISGEPSWNYLPQYLDRFLFAENIQEQLGHLLSENLDRSSLLALLTELDFNEPEEILEFPFILMSGGERRRIALAMVFYLKPKHLILDEPEIGITAKENMVLRGKINNLQATTTRIILITHNDLFVKGASNLICLKEGRVDRVGKTRELLADPGFKLLDYGVRLEQEMDRNNN